MARWPACDPTVSTPPCDIVTMIFVFTSLIGVCGPSSTYDATGPFAYSDS